MITDGGAGCGADSLWSSARHLPPADAEGNEILTAALNAQLDRYRKNPEAATKLVSIGAKRATEARRPELAAYTCRQRHHELGRDDQ